MRRLVDEVMNGNNLEILDQLCSPQLAPKMRTAFTQFGDAFSDWLQERNLDERTLRLVTLGVAVGALAEGSVRSNTRPPAGAGADDVRQVALFAITTRGFPAAIAALGWIDEVVG